MEQHENEGLAYNGLSLLRLRGTLDYSALEQSFMTLVERHEILRTIFVQDGGVPYQKILSVSSSGFSLVREDLRGYSSPESEAIRRAHAVRETPFALEAGSMMKVILFELGSESYLLMIVTHHIITDEWSVHLMSRELGTLYNSFREGGENPLPSLPIQYRDYSTWLHANLGGVDHSSARDYWLSQFEDEVASLELPMDYPRPRVRSFRGSEYRTILPESMLSGLQALTQAQGATLFMGLNAVLTTLLYRYTGNRDIVLGTPVAGRDHPDLENLLGLFLNVLALRTRFSETETFNGLLTRVKETTLGGFAHQSYPFDHLLNELSLEMDLNRMPLFDVTLILQNVDLGIEMEAEGLEITMVEEEQHIAKGDLRFQFSELESGLSMSIEYNTDIYSEERIIRMSGHFEQLLSSVLSDPDQSLSKLSYLSASEEADELYFNQTLLREDQVTITTLFESTALAHGEELALVCGHSSMRYEELSAASNRLSHVLMSLDQGPSQVIGVFLPPGLDLVCSLLAILKSGKVYLPLSLDYGKGRILQILRENNVDTLLCAASNEGWLTELLLSAGSPQVSHLVLISDNREEILSPGWEEFNGGAIGLRTLEGSSYASRPMRIVESPVTSPTIDITSDSPAYLFYTSGSTGQPKGIQGNHGSLSHYLQWHRTTLGISRDSRVAQLATPTFDASLKDILTTLISGGQLCIVPASVRENMDSLGSWLERSSVTHLQTVPSLFRLLLSDLGLSGRKLPALEWIVLAGERLYGQDVSSWQSLQGDKARLVNMYGLTETTILKTYHEIEVWEGASGDVVPVGKPISNTLIAVINEGGLCLNGEIGDVYIKSPYLSDGYVDTTLNGDLFVQNPLNEMPDVVCKTGDLGRLTVSGDLEILGRKDDQVKLHGVRVELEEVRTALYSVPGVEGVELIVHQGSDLNTELLCYYTGSQEDVGVIRSALSDQLPSSHVPGYFIWLSEFPLNLNGKVDRQSLPRPDQVVKGGSYASPSGYMEESLSLIWSRVLGRDQISRHDSFFEVGGSSLKVIQLISLIYKEHEVQLTINDVFEHPDLSSQARLISATVQTEYAPIPRSAEQASYVISHAQRRQWVIDQLTPETTVYNMPNVVILEGDLDKDRLSSAFKKLIKRHEILRTYFGMIEEDVVQYIEDEIQFTLVHYKSEKDQVPEIVNSFIKPFDLSLAPLLRVGLIELTNDLHVFMVDMHHILTDGISKSIMIKEFASLYNGDNLPEVKLQYKDFAVWQQSEEQQREVEKQREFWLREFTDEIKPLQLPTKFPRPVVKNFSGDLISFELDQEDIEGLKIIGSQEEATLFMVIFSVYNVLLSKLSGSEDIIIGCPTAGRDHPDLENVLGMFVNTLCLRNYPKAEFSFRQFLANVKSKVIDCFENERYPYESLVDDLQVDRDTSRNPIFDVMISYQNFQFQELEMEGLTLKPYTRLAETAKFDLSLIVTENEDTLLFEMEYSTELFEESQIKYFIDHFKQIVKRVVAEPDVNLSTLDILSEAERYQIIYEFNTPGSDNSAGDNIVSLLERQVEETPEKLAFICGGEEITYSQLNKQANKLAHCLRNSGVKEESLIPICINPNLDMMVAICAILKAGAAYVPINPEHPLELIRFMIEDTGALVSVFSQENINRFRGFDETNILVIEEELAKIDVPTTSLGLNILPEQLAYVIYTSGSSGKPKGVMVEHRSITNYLFNSKTNYIEKGGESTGTYMHLSYAFDASVTGIFMPLLCGKSTVLATGSGVDAFSDPTFFKYAPYDFLKLTPAHLTVLNAEYDLSDREIPVKKLVVGGETLYKHHFKFLKSGMEVINEYGPTEATVGCSTFRCLAGDIDQEHIQIPIGSPIDNVQIYILDSRQKLLPVGVPGELCIGGDSLARSYLNLPELTDEKFIKDPFGTSSDARLYKTGDLARWLPDGNLEFLGRMDGQIKVRGYRVELGEVENSLLTHPEISEAVVVMKSQDGDQSLVSYYVSDKELEVRDVRSFLAEKLPGYMVPDYFEQLDKIPLTPNGKINKRILPVPTLSIEKTYQPPANETEEKMVEIWSDILKLNVDQISTTTSFFELGGHSLNATLVVNKIRNVFDHSLTLQLFFRMPTVSQLSKFLSTIDAVETDLELQENQEEFNF